MHGDSVPSPDRSYAPGPGRVLRFGFAIIADGWQMIPLQLVERLLAGSYAPAINCMGIHFAVSR